MANKILIIGNGSQGIGVNEALRLKLEEELGKDIIIITPEEAKERGIEIINPTECPLEKQKIKSLLLEKEPPKVIDTLIKSGREERNQRRKSIKRNKGIKPKYQGRKSR